MANDKTEYTATSKESKLAEIQKQIDKLIEEREALKSNAVQQDK